MQLEFDFTELTDYTQKLYKLAQQQFPKETKQMLNEQGKILRARTVKSARASVKKKTGNYFKSIKKGKVYKYQNRDFAIRVYGKNHANLIEYGHRIVRGGEELGFVPGRDPFKKASQDYEQEFIYAINNLVDKLLDKGLR